MLSKTSSVADKSATFGFSIPIRSEKLITFFKIFPMFYENIQLQAALSSVQQDQNVDPKSKKKFKKCCLPKQAPKKGHYYNSEYNRTEQSKKTS